MGRWLRGVVLATAVSFGAVVGSSGEAMAAAEIRGQAPCTAACVAFTATSFATSVRTFRSFAYRAPSRGNALVTFHGTLNCLNRGVSGNRVVDLITQITDSASATPNLDQPGGMRQNMVINSATGGVNQALILDSTRVFNFTAAGTKTFQFQVRKLRIDADIVCTVPAQAAFSVVFIP